MAAVGTAVVVVVVRRFDRAVGSKNHAVEWTSCSPEIGVVDGGWEVAEMEVPPPAAAMIPYGRKFGVLVVVVVVVVVRVLKFVLVIAAAESPVFLAYLSQPVHLRVPVEKSTVHNMT